MLAVSQQLGIQSELIPRIATAFGGGIGGRGEVCGAVIGSVMSIGLKYGREEPSQPHLETYALAREFCRRFDEETGSLSCRELTGMDLSTPEGVQAFQSSDVPLRVCLPAIGAAFRLVTELLGRPAPPAADD
ncbi:MAG: C_GCAxxG_C_C family protein [Dehalococcoidia bacterium]|nr:MAG: C_GCAxxG_C_C family protein [Dehalococcoidia bacterium]